MSAFGVKRKARKITVQDDDDDTISPEALNPLEEPQGPALQPSFKTSRNKPFKHSSLRKSINVDKLEDDAASDQLPTSTNIKTEAENDEDDGAPLRSRPPLGGRSGSSKIKKKASSSRLSFGVPSEEVPEDEDSMILGEEFSTPKRLSTLAHAVAENSAYKKGIAKNLPLGRLPMRSNDTDDNRPRYSKEYLSELQQSTPNTPQDLSKLQPTSDDEMILDASELEGALIVDTAPTHPASSPKKTAILAEAEIQEKKARRARLAKEGSKDTDDFISLSDDDNNNDRRGAGDSYLTVLSRRREPKHMKSSKDNTRLVAEDEDLGEGFDEFVEDGGLSLGKRAEREARRRRRAEIASLITAAEGGGGEGGEEEESDDSEAERRAAYEAAQTRAGMDGLAEERRKRLLGAGAGAGGQNPQAIIPRITPLPDLSVLVAEFKARMRRKQEDMARLRARIEELRREREGILAREPEVQRLLNEAGERYRALMMAGAADARAGNAEGGGGGSNNNGGKNGDDAVAGNNATTTGTFEAAQSLLDQVRAGGGGGGTPGQRGLDSLGTTPVRQKSQVEMEMEMEM
ncbi:nineteen complex-related protein 2-domain-containing protein [Daldinia caldariorum]|uniref:nineteen complex-related protein 2-domain-containing protein n=1 Tax=Daldinia caldariorum TaxID=326644 RepID=UPI0020084FA5|nr:nineteen complex-related protein 2-domain-containing protein [Daldinia caldariorum]KAI1464359.1 nineteen complex-related protein 2-domain-containing protein [Daldinia caldariorum]